MRISILLFILSIFFNPTVFAQSVNADPCEPCVPPTPIEAYSQADVVLMVRSRGVPTMQNPVVSYDVLEIIKARPKITIPKTFTLQARFKDCKRGLFLPPSQTFIVFLNKGDSFELLPCRAGEIAVENNLVILNGEKVKISKLAEWFEVAIKRTIETTNSSENADIPPDRYACVQNEDCELRHADCLVHECACPEALNRKWFPSCGREVKFFKTDKKSNCNACPKVEVKCLKNRCSQVLQQ